jgi:hypothetical protein
MRRPINRTGVFTLFEMIGELGQELKVMDL